MRKSSKFLAGVMAGAMVLAAMPFTASAATSLTKETNVLTDSDYYNVSLNNGSSGDYINFEYTGVGQDGVWYVTPDTDLTLVMSDGSGYSSNNLTANGYTLGWHYGSSTSYCLSTDTAWTMVGTDNDYEFTISSGIGQGLGDSFRVYAGTEGNTMTSEFTLEGGLPEGTYTFEVTYKLQMKKKPTIGSWSTSYELTTTDTITIVSKTFTEGVGGSIRVDGTQGFRLGFITEEDADTIEEYGFLYVYDSVDTLTPDTEGVKTLVASNHITHDEDTDDEYTSFNLVFTNMPSSAYDTDVTACSYVVIDGETHYSEPVTRNFTQVANAVLADESISDSIKETVQAMLDGEGF